MASDGLFAPLRDAALSAGRRGGGISLSASSLGAAVQARAAGYIEPVLVGPRAHRAAAGESGLPAGGLEIIDAPDDELESARPRRRWRATAPWAC